MKARYYDGDIGRFLSVDPIAVITNPKEFKAKTGMDYAKYLSDPQLLNTYSYVRNNPLTYTDPSGEFLDIAADIAFIAYDLCKVGQAIFTGGDVAGEITSLGLDIAGAALPGVTGLGMVARTARVADKAGDVASVANKLPDNALVCRGGLCTAERLIKGKGVTVNGGKLDGASVNAGDITLSELTKNIPHSDYGLTTVGEIRKLGGNVVKDAKKGYHSIMQGITPKQAENLFTPTKKIHLKITNLKNSLFTII